MLGKQHFHFATSAYIFFPLWYMVLVFFSLVIYGTSNLGYKPVFLIVCSNTASMKHTGKKVVIVLLKKKLLMHLFMLGNAYCTSICVICFFLKFFFYMYWFSMAFVGRSDWPSHSSSRTPGRFLSNVHPNCHQWGAFCVWRWLPWQQGPVYVVFYFTSLPFVSNT